MRINDLHPTTKRLVLARAFRSVGQGALVVDLALYLHALGWNGFHIGLVLSAAGLFGAFLSLGVGVASDRMRRRPFLLVYESIVFVCSIAAFLTAQSVILSITIIAAGFGRGANGAAGPFSPVEQAWLAEEVPAVRRGWVYSMNTAFGFFGMGFGALLAMLPEFLSAWIGKGHSPMTINAIAYRPLFLIVTAATIGNILLIFNAKEKYSGSRQGNNADEKQEEKQIRRKENKMLTGLVFLNSFNGLAIGFTGPLISYWFAIRFGVGPASIAPIMAATFFFTGISSLLTGRVSEKIGIVKSVVWARFIGLLLLISLPLMPFFWLASLVYLLRSAFNRGSVGARQALTVGLVRDKRRGLATSLNAMSMQLPQSVGPSIAGLLFSTGQLELPFYVGAIFQGAYLIMYGRFFRGQNKPQSEEPE
ncbi:MAG TPA: MFS transporter [Ignavibacteriaceae bacterium]|nr:MFS transporter [Ignavibacteriaceae bacterium]